MVANKNNNVISAAICGILNYPFLLPANILNDDKLGDEEKVNNILSAIDDKITDNLSGSKDYKKFVTKNTLMQMFKNMREA